MFNTVSLTIKEEFLLDVFFLKLQKLLSTCPEELELLAESSFFEQEMMVKIKNNIRKL